MRNKLVVVLTLVFSLVFAADTALGATKKYQLRIEISSEDWKTYGKTSKEAGISLLCAAGKESKLFNSVKVKIKNQSDKVIGIAKTSWKVNDIVDPSQSSLGLYFEGSCLLTAIVKNLPKASFYQVQVGEFDAGIYEFSELVNDKWKLNLTYG